MAVFFGRCVVLIPGDEDVGCGFDVVVGDGFEFVDFEHSGYLGGELFGWVEVAVGDVFDGGGGLGVCEVVGVEGVFEVFLVAVGHEEEFVGVEGLVVVGEAGVAV